MLSGTTMPPTETAEIISKVASNLANATNGIHKTLRQNLNIAAKNAQTNARAPINGSGHSQPKGTKRSHRNMQAPAFACMCHDAKAGPDYCPRAMLAKQAIAGDPYTVWTMQRHNSKLRKTDLLLIYFLQKTNSSQVARSSLLDMFPSIRKAFPKFERHEQILKMALYYSRIPFCPVDILPTDTLEVKRQKRITFFAKLAGYLLQLFFHNLTQPRPSSEIRTHILAQFYSDILRFNQLGLINHFFIFTDEWLKNWATIYPQHKSKIIFAEATLPNDGKVRGSSTYMIRCKQREQPLEQRLIKTGRMRERTSKSETISSWHDCLATDLAYGSDEDDCCACGNDYCPGCQDRCLRCNSRKCKLICRELTLYSIGDTLASKYLHLFYRTPDSVADLEMKAANRAKLVRQEEPIHHH